MSRRLSKTLSEDDFDLPLPIELDGNNFIEETIFLQLCASFNWQLLDRHTTKMMHGLLVLGDSGDLQRKHFILHSAYSNLTATDEWGNTPLHLACYNQAPLQTIQFITQLSNLVRDKVHSFKNLDLRSILAKDHSSPFLITCAFRSEFDDNDVELARYLMFHDDDKDAMYKSKESLKIEMNRSKRISIQPDQNGSTPLLEIINAAKRKGLDVFYSLEPSQQGNDDRPVYMRKVALRSKIVMLLRGAIAETEADLHDARICKDISDVLYHQLVIYAMATVPHLCPFEEFLRNSLALIQPDKDLVTKLFRLAIKSSVVHLIATKTSPTFTVGTERQLNVLCDGEDYVVNALLEFYPNAGWFLVPSTSFNSIEAGNTVLRLSQDKNTKVKWRSPLCEAVASGIRWYSVNETDSRKSSFGPLYRIWKSAPEALEARDLITGLYPFMLAAAVTHTNTNEFKCDQEEEEENGSNVEGEEVSLTSKSTDIPMAETEEETRENEWSLKSKLSRTQIGTIYGLLRTCPQVMDMILAHQRSG